MASRVGPRGGWVGSSRRSAGHARTSRRRGRRGCARARRAIARRRDRRSRRRLRWGSSRATWSPSRRAVDPPRYPAAYEHGGGVTTQRSLLPVSRTSGRGGGRSARGRAAGTGGARDPERAGGGRGERRTPEGADGARGGASARAERGSARAVGRRNRTPRPATGKSAANVENKFAQAPCARDAARPARRCEPRVRVCRRGRLAAPRWRPRRARSGKTRRRAPPRTPRAESRRARARAFEPAMSVHFPGRVRARARPATRTRSSVSSEGARERVVNVPPVPAIDPSRSPGPAATRDLRPPRANPPLEGARRVGFTFRE